MDFTRAHGVRLLRRYPWLSSIPYWSAALMVGAVSVIFAELFEWITSLSQSWASTHPYFFLAGAPLLFAVSSALVMFVAPTSGGSGIPQVMAALQMDARESPGAIKHLLSLRVMIVKVVSSLCCLLGGGLVGREGPTVQIGATVFRLVGSRFTKIWEDTQIHSWIIAGGAAGIAAAFNTPLGGIVFAIEELSNIHFSRLKTALLSAVIVAGMMAQLMAGPYLYFGYPHVDDFHMRWIPWVLALGLIAGVLGGIFGRCLLAGSRWTRTLLPRTRVAVAAVCGLVVAAGGLWVGPQLLGGGTGLVRGLLFEQHVVPSLSLVGGRFVGTVLSYLAGGAGGIFAPSLAIGASLGAYLAPWADFGNPNTMILLGMAAFLTAVTRAPFTATVLVLEMTDRHSLIFPLMLAALSAQLGALAVDRRSFYHEQARHFVLTVRGVMEK